MNKEQLSKISDLLRQTRVEVAPETFFLISLSHQDWSKLLESPELSPRMTAPFMIFRDKTELTLLLDDIDFKTIRHAIRDAKIAGNYRLLTFDIELDFTIIGFLAEVTRILADAEISIIALSAFSRDHLLIKQEDLPRTLKVLGEYVAELC
ncbi:MAG TPA: ACT domain-containing protein [Pyrinomonadaceae bacterium]|nr:ACT domain-containing protein [Pyrinomonadaceae bacterium]